MKGIRIAIGLVIAASLLMGSCIKKNFDSPPDQNGLDPKLPVNLTISQLNTIALSTTRQIVGDSTISGIVVADDRSGNFYKQIIIQDSTGGIAIGINAYSLYNDYPVGRKIYLKLKGLYIGTYKGLPQIGYTIDNTGAMLSMPSTLMTNYIVKANYPNDLPKKHVTLSQLTGGNSSLLNTLIYIDSVEFKSADAGQVWAMPGNLSSGTGRYIEDCSNHSLEVYTSGYADFQNYLTPTGKGTVTGIYSIYSGSPQFIVRDTTDAVM